MAMPVSTPPNAMAYATGEVARADMMRAGSLVSAIALVLLLIGYRIVLPWAF
jgi:sodium-dependent dicarboxylate transporter 2/3/5